MKEEEQEISFKSFIVPFTTTKAIHYIIFIGLLVFGNMLFNGFVGDDFGQIVYNQLVHSPTNIPEFFVSSSFQLGSVITGLYYKTLLSTSYTIINFRVYDIYTSAQYSYRTARADTSKYPVTSDTYCT